VDFRTASDDDALLDAYRRAAVTVQASENEGGQAPPPELMGFTVLESQACGTPVVVSDAGPMADFVEPGRTGWIFRAGDSADLARALRVAVAESSEAREEECRRHAERYSWSKVAESHLELYRELLNEDG